MMEKIEISKFAYDYLEQQVARFTDTPATILDRIIKEHASSGSKRVSLGKAQSNKENSELSFSLNSTPNVSFTTIKEAKINGNAVELNNWNGLLKSFLEICFDKFDSSDVKSKLKLQFRDGEHTDNGYRVVENHKVSFQGVDSTRALESIKTLSKEYLMPVEIHLYWQDKPKAQFAGRDGKIFLP